MKKLRKILLRIVLLFFGSTILSVFAYRYIPVYFTPLMFIRCYQQVAAGEDLRLKHQWVPLEEMSEGMPIAVMASEDQKFLEHKGFDFEAIEQARKEAEKGGRRRGASTISQQTAKNVFLWPSSTWTRKAFETYFTVLIELMWSKERIMEVYLNSIEMGNGIYGAQAVAEENFGREALTLTNAQCALIAATLPNPRMFSSAHPSLYMYKRQSQILRQMRHVRHRWNERNSED